VLKYFENLIDPYPSAPPETPPRGFFAFLWAGTQGLRKYMLAMTLLSALIGVFEAALFGMLGRVVDTLGALRHDRLWIEGRLAMTEFARMLDGSTAMTIGWYHDRYVEEDGLWRFARRHWSFKYRGAPDLTGAFVDTPDYGAFPDGPAEDEPTFVRKT